MIKKITIFFIFLGIIILPVNAAVTPNDTHYSKQWYLDRIKANNAWEGISESPNVIIAIIDSGVQIDHPDLKANIWRNVNEIPNNNIDDDKNGFIDDINGWDFVNKTPDPSPKFSDNFTESGISHGTIVAGIASAVGNNGLGISGVTWKSKIMSLKVLSDSGQGNANDVVRAIDYAINNGADIINFSFVGFGYQKALSQAIERAYNAGIIMVAAAGNEGENDGRDTDSHEIYPACYDEQEGINMVIGVAGTDGLDQKTSFSSFGYKCVDISAPAVSFYTTVTFGGGYYQQMFNKYYDGYWSGTSMAAPQVSGALALILEANPTLTRDEVVGILLDNTDNISRLNPDYLGKLGSGRLNVEKAVSVALSRLKRTKQRIVVSPASDHESKVRIFNGDYIIEDFNVYADNFRGGVNTASGDLNGDGQNEIVVGAGPSGGPHVRVFNQKGELKTQFFAYDINFRGGINIAVGDLDGDGIDDIIVTMASNGTPDVKVFSMEGRLKSHFLAYNKYFKGGVNVASGDLDGDGIDEIVTGAGIGGGPQVRIFDIRGNVKGQFFAYDKNFRGGVRVAVGDIDGRVDKSKKEIITTPGANHIPQVKVFDAHSRLKSSFLAYSSEFKNGITVTVGDLDNDGIDEIITGTGLGMNSNVRVFLKHGELLESFTAFADDFEGGINVAIVEMSN